MLELYFSKITIFLLYVLNYVIIILYSKKNSDQQNLFGKIPSVMRGIMHILYTSQSQFCSSETSMREQQMLKKCLQNFISSSKVLNFNFHENCKTKQNTQNCDIWYRPQIYVLFEYHLSRLDCLHTNELFANRKLGKDNFTYHGNVCHN